MKKWKYAAIYIPLLIFVTMTVAANLQLHGIETPNPNLISEEKTVWMCQYNGSTAKVVGREDPVKRHLGFLPFIESHWIQKPIKFKYRGHIWDPGFSAMDIDKENCENVARDALNRGKSADKAGQTDGDIE